MAQNGNSTSAWPRKNEHESLTQQWHTPPTWICLWTSSVYSCRLSAPSGRQAKKLRVSSHRRWEALHIFHEGSDASSHEDVSWPGIPRNLEPEPVLEAVKCFHSRHSLRKVGLLGPSCVARIPLMTRDASSLIHVFACEYIHMYIAQYVKTFWYWFVYKNSPRKTSSKKNWNYPELSIEIIEEDGHFFYRKLERRSPWPSAHVYSAWHADRLMGFDAFYFWKEIS